MRERLRTYQERVWTGIARAFAEDNTPREIAASFALGTFVAVLPTGGTALVLFVVVGYLIDRVSKIGLLASLIVFNPVVKWSIYGASFWLGSLVLGPVPGVTLSQPPSIDLSGTVAPALLLRQLVGNLVFAGLLAVLGYLVTLHLVRAYIRRDNPLPDQHT